MNTSLDKIRQSIASNKFYPPRINQSQSLLRQAIISDRLPKEHHSRKIVVIEAQAGQGKTTLVHQYLEHSRHPFLWYQVGTEDSDPVLLLSALLLAFSRKIDTFTSPQLIAILENGQVGPMDLQGCANILLHDIDGCLSEDLYVVFDDLHLISDAQLTNQLLDYLIDTSPPRLHFILTSRQSLQLSADAVRKNPYLTYLETADLALDLTDIENLYNVVMGAAISRGEAEEILQVTNGWIMGIVLAAHPFALGTKKRSEKKTDGGKSHLLVKDKNGYILNYFEEEIFSHLPEFLHTTFLKLSFLDELDVNLARILTDIDEIDQHLDRMADENFFVYRLDDKNQVFRFHHLFQEFLQIKSRQIHDLETVSGIYRQAADYYLEYGMTEKALKALCNGEAYQEMEAVLQSHGLGLVSANRTVTIRRILQSIPENTLLEHSWLTFFHGLLATDFTPRQTLPFFETCRNQFAESGEEAGELMSLSQLIYYHFVISGNYHTGSELLKRTKTLFERTHESLPTEITILVARNLAAGYCFFDGEMKLARHYAQWSCDLATRRQSRNFIAATRFTLGYIGLLGGNRRAVRSETEKSYPLGSDPLVGMSNRLTLHIMQLCELSMYGDFVEFLHNKDMIQAGVAQKVVRQTVAGPYLYIWTSIALVGQGRTAEAIEVIEQGMFASKTASTGHMTSQFLQWRAFSHSICGRDKQALRDIEASTSLRSESGGPFYAAYNHAVRGATLTMLGLSPEARDAFAEALRIAEAIPSPYVKACCLAYLAYLDIVDEDMESAPRTIGKWLELMKENDYGYFWGWEPKSMTRLLCSAVQMDIEPEFARSCARERLGLAISPDGEPIPILAIRVLGEFSIGTLDQKLFGPQDLSPHQRELIGLLISSPQQRISQEQVQLTFWPDNPPDKARKTLDTLMTRLRNTLSEKLPVPATTYINLEKGYIQLNHADIDAVTFLHTAESGLRLGKQGLWWQAGNAFTKALSCWSAFLPTETFIKDQTVAFNDDIQATMGNICLVWCRKLSELNRIDEATALLDKTDKILSVDEDCVLLRYRFLLIKHKPLKARDVLNSYRQELLRLGYTHEEADETIASLTKDRNIR